MNPKIPLTKEALPAGVCVNHPEAAKGSACASDPCGKCSETKCVGSSQNSWGYKCVPTAKSVAIMSKSTGKFFELKQYCFGRRRRRKCVWQLVAVDKKSGNEAFVSLGGGECKAEVLKKIKTVRKPTDCIKEGVKLGGKAVTWKRRFTRRWGQSCTVYKQACSSVTRDRRVWSYALTEGFEQFELVPRGNGQFQVRQAKVWSGYNATVCLAMGAEGLHGTDCSAEGPKEQLFDVARDCKGDGGLKNSGKCVQSSPDGKFVGRTCDSHVAGQQFSVIGV
jgi:hypothetical protein